jgi:hypothetical protein
LGESPSAVGAGASEHPFLYYIEGGPKIIAIIQRAAGFQEDFRPYWSFFNGVITNLDG